MDKTPKILIAENTFVPFCLKKKVPYIFNISHLLTQK